MLRQQGEGDAAVVGIRRHLIPHQHRQGGGFGQGLPHPLHEHAEGVGEVGDGAVVDAVQTAVDGIGAVVQQNFVEAQFGALLTQLHEILPCSSLAGVQPAGGVIVVPQPAVAGPQQPRLIGLGVGKVHIGKAGDAGHSPCVAGEEGLEACQRLRAAGGDGVPGGGLRVIGDGAVPQLHRDHHRLRVLRQHGGGILRQHGVRQLAGVKLLQQRVLRLIDDEIHVIRRGVLRLLGLLRLSLFQEGQLQMPVALVIVDHILLRHQISHGGQQDQHQHNDQRQFPVVSATVALITSGCHDDTSFFSGSGLDGIQLCHPAGMASALKFGV